MPDTPVTIMTSQIGKEQETLPEHWEMRVDTRTGMPYYLNHLKQFTTWDDPRVVQDPRCMLNDMGSMTRRRSVSPTPSASRRRINEDGSTSIPFSHFLSPAELDYSQHTQSLPRPRRQNKPIFGDRNCVGGGSWFQTGLDEPSNDFFSDSSWPAKSHSLRMRPLSPFNVNGSAEQMRKSPQNRGSPPRQSAQSNFSQKQGVDIPITTKFADTITPEVEEGIIIPTQYKTVPVADEHLKSQGSPHPKLAKQEQEMPLTNCNTSEQHASQNSLKRTDSDYDNNLRIGDSQANKLSTDINDNEESSSLLDSVGEHSDANNGHLKLDQTNSKDESVVDSVTDDLNNAKDYEENGETDEESKVLQEKTDRSYEAIGKVKDEVEGYRKEVEDFKGEKQSKEFRYLDEMLTRCQLALDNVETHGDVELRKKRKETVNHIELLLQLLDSQCQSSSS